MARGGGDEQRVWSGVWKEDASEAIWKSWQEMGQGLVRFCQMSVLFDCIGAPILVEVSMH